MIISAGEAAAGWNSAVQHAKSHTLGW